MKTISEIALVLWMESQGICGKDPFSRYFAEGILRGLEEKGVRYILSANLPELRSFELYIFRDGKIHSGSSNSFARAVCLAMHNMANGETFYLEDDEPQSLEKIEVRD